MKLPATDYKKFDHDAHARTRPPEDFWGQIRRTVNGQPVSQEQIDLILAAVRNALRLGADDTLLDLACGNGALSSALFDQCHAYLGVDFSEYLITVAKQYFEAPPHFLFLLQSAPEYAVNEPDPTQFTKVLCYGSFSYFPADSAVRLLRDLHERFTGVDTVFIGNLPDKDRATDFYKTAQPNAAELADHASQIGIWRTRDEFAELAATVGWRASFSVMPSAFYASYYRYDVTLQR